MGELGALFNPGMRHEQEERRSKALQREEEGDSREVDPRIDLESGVAVIPTGDQDSAAASNGSDTDETQPPSAAAQASPAASHDADSDGASTTQATNDTADADEAAAPARPRPRGKRGMAARTR